jgi:hypothetical protein
LKTPENGGLLLQFGGMVRVGTTVGRVKFVPFVYLVFYAEIWFALNFSFYAHEEKLFITRDKTLLSYWKWNITSNSASPSSVQTSTGKRYIHTAERWTTGEAKQYLNISDWRADSSRHDT